MAITNLNSTQYANQVADPVVKQPPSVIFGAVRYAKFNYTQVGAGDAGSIANLVEIQPGKTEVLEIYVSWSAMGASRTMDLGYAAYTDENNDAVAADPDAFHSGEDVSSAGTVRHIEQTLIESIDGWVLTAQINDAAFDDGETLDGFILFVGDN